MGFFKGLGKVLNKVKNVALPVIGTALAGPLGGVAGGALAGAVGNGKPQLKRIAGNAAMGGVGGMLGGGQAGAQALLGGGVKGLATGGAGGMLKRAGGFLMDNPELVAGGLAAIEGHENSRKADRYRDKALGLQEAEYAARAPLRAEGLRRLSAPEPAPLPRYRGSNPFSR
jgi:hypothetical protein